LNKLPAIFLFGLFHQSLSQGIIEGSIVNQKSKAPIPYANIGIAKINIGTISNEDGSFSLKIPDGHQNDTLQFSALGYGKKTIALSSLLPFEKQVIYLNENSIILAPVTVSSKKEKNKFFELGNNSYQGGVIETDTIYAGRSLALLIENKQPNFYKDFYFPVYLQKAKLRIFKNNLKLLRFRVRLNLVDSLTGQPGDDLLHQSVVIESSIRNGWLEFDLSSLHLWVAKAFFVTFEQILDSRDRTAIADGFRNFISEHPNKIDIDTVIVNGRKETRTIIKGGGMDLPGTFIGIGVSESVKSSYSSYVRDTSFGEWKKVGGILTATVIVSNQEIKPKQVLH